MCMGSVYIYIYRGVYISLDIYNQISVGQQCRGEGGGGGGGADVRVSACSTMLCGAHLDQWDSRYYQ